MNTKPTQLMRSRTAGLGWALGAACALSLQSTLGHWIFAEHPRFFAPVQMILLLFHLLVASLTWACVRFLSPVLARIYPRQLAPRMVFGQLAILSCVLLTTMAVYLQLFPLVMGRDVFPGGQFQVACRALMVAVFVYGWLTLREYALDQSLHAAHVQRETDALATDLDRSELAMLEAQIEPHFLFNTLAHVKRLYRIDDDAGGEVLARLIDYLQRALPALRQPDWNVAEELALISLYLNLIEQRFGGKMRYRISVDAVAGAHLLPALTVATLVDNAVRHGVTPKAGAATIEVSATVQQGQLVIDVLDDGMGLRQTSGTGLGLATVRARLRARFGTAAQLLVVPGESGGVRSSIHIAAGPIHA